MANGFPIFCMSVGFYVALSGIKMTVSVALLCFFMAFVGTSVALCRMPKTVAVFSVAAAAAAGVVVVLCVVCVCVCLLVAFVLGPCFLSCP